MSACASKGHFFCTLLYVCAGGEGGAACACVRVCVCVCVCLSACVLVPPLELTITLWGVLQVACVHDKPAEDDPALQVYLCLQLVYVRVRLHGRVHVHVSVHASVLACNRIPVSAGLIVLVYMLQHVCFS